MRHFIGKRSDRNRIKPITRPWYLIDPAGNIQHFKTWRDAMNSAAEDLTR